MEEKELKNMELHETKCINNHTDVLKVVGGWIYNQTYSDINGDVKLVSSVFVPVFCIGEEIANLEQTINRK